MQKHRDIEHDVNYTDEDFREQINEPTQTEMLTKMFRPHIILVDNSSAKC